jgi:HK97 family phage major capsid protein
MGIEELKAAMAEGARAADAIMRKAEAENRDTTDDERATIDTIREDHAKLRDRLERAQAVATMKAEMAKPEPRKAAPVDTLTQTDGDPDYAVLARPDVVRHRGTWDWQTFGEFAKAVRRHCQPGGATDPRLTARMAPTNIGTGSVGADGGFAVPPDFRNEINELCMGERSLVGLCDQLTTSSSSLSLPKDATTPWQTSGGILAYWEGEGAQMTDSKPSLQREMVPVNSLTCLVPVTEDLMEDAPALDSYLRRKAPAKMAFKADLAIVQGTGVGQPQGILNSSALVTVAKESSQTADTINFANIAKMWCRLYASSRPTSVWLINQDCEYQLMKLEFTGTNSSTPAYLPANGLAASPYGTLLGRPVIPHQACETVGDLGDILLIDLKQYMWIQRTAGIKADVSMHLWFDYNILAYRFVWRAGGRPWWDATISPRDGSSTLSPFVALAERA